LVTIPKYLENRAMKIASSGSRTPATVPKAGGKGGEEPPSTGVRFISAGLAACTADLLTFPLDTAKVRLQVI